MRHYTKLVSDSYYPRSSAGPWRSGLTVTRHAGHRPVAFFARTRSRWRNWLTILVVFRCC
jgi:hypothetical protein